MKVAIVYDRVNKWGGAERVLLELHKMFPDAPLYTSVYDSKKASWAKVFPKVHTSFLQKIPFTKSNHEFLAPFMPFVFSRFNFDQYDLVISVTSEAAKGIKTRVGSLHICYCLTPTRYLWSHYDEYFKDMVFKGITRPIIFWLRKWDIKASKRPDIMIAISTEVKKRIKKYYKRNVIVIYPPVNNYKVRSISSRNRKHYLVVSRLVGYKRVSLAVEAFNILGLPLVIVGAGRQESKLKRIANKNIKFVGKVSEKALANYYKHAKALIMPQNEDFGIVSVEAQIYGVPVVAFKGGGTMDTVIEGKTGILFNKQNIESLIGAINKFQETKFKEKNIQKNAKRFSKEIFLAKFSRIIKDAGK